MGGCLGCMMQALNAFWNFNQSRRAVVENVNGVIHKGESSTWPYVEGLRQKTIILKATGLSSRIKGKKLINQRKEKGTEDVRHFKSAANLNYSQIQKTELISFQKPPLNGKESREIKKNAIKVCIILIMTTVPNVKNDLYKLMTLALSIQLYGHFKGFHCPSLYFFIFVCETSAELKLRHRRIRVIRLYTAHSKNKNSISNSESASSQISGKLTLFSRE